MQENRLITGLLTVIAVFIVGVVLYLLRTVLLPFVIALLLSNLFIPVVRGLRSRRVPTIVALFVVLLSVSAILFLLSLILYSSFDSFVAELPKYRARSVSMMISVFDQFEVIATDFGIPDIPELDPVQMIDLESVTSAVTSGIGSFVSVISYTFLVVLFMLFMLAESADVGFRIRQAFPGEQAERISTMLMNIDGQVRQYLLTKTLISLGTGLLTTVVLWIIGVDFALLFGFLAFLLNFIPNVGSMIAALLPFILALLQFETLTEPLLVLVLLGGVQMLMGNAIEPRLMAFSLNLSALIVLVSLIFWGWLWGILGMVLAVPLTATVKIIFENVTDLKPFAILMSGRSEKSLTKSLADELVDGQQAGANVNKGDAAELGF